MNPISARFEDLRSTGRKALVPFVTGGDPSLDDLPAILAVLQEAGADLIEVGVPFSDPIADGPTIQASSQRALDRGVTPSAILSRLALAELRVPVLLMGYYNTILRFGTEAFAVAAGKSGVSGTIVSDLTPEEAGDWIAASRTAGLNNVFLAAPTSTDARLDAVCGGASGFVYAVSRTGVTGVGSALPDDVRSLVHRIQARTTLPVCVGFGISTPEQVRMVCEVADGAVVGSWLVNLLAERWDGGRGAPEIVRLVRDLKKGTL